MFLTGNFCFLNGGHVFLWSSGHATEPCPPYNLPCGCICTCGAYEWDGEKCVKTHPGWGRLAGLVDVGE
jgi:hypothetical protein